MAKFEGTQNVPSEWLDQYRGTLNPHPTGNVAKKRYPYRLPKMQEGGKGVKPAQLKQRTRFKQAIAKFKEISYTQKQRWYDSEPPWSSFLWYYNYFVMSALAGNANINAGGAGVIKSIQYVTAAMSTGSPANVTVSIATVDPGKCVMMLYGAGAYNIAGDLFVQVYPVPIAINSSQAIIKNSIQNDTAYTAGITVIEYI